MLNVNILNNLIKGISEQIPLVHSYYTSSPYESWNVEEIKYGSVSFVITRINTRESNTVYEATIYYADRLLENSSNRDSIHSDAATVIQTIVGALNQSDDYLDVSYPVAINLFEQSFADSLAGGYAQLVITTKGMGECFEDDIEIPNIVATSAYWTKDEIMELFPLRTQLATIAYTGSYNDLKDKPNLVTQEQYDELFQAVLDTTADLAKEINGKVSIGKYDAWSQQIETELDNKATLQQYNDLYNAVKDATGNLAEEISNKVSSGYFAEWSNGIETELDNKATKQSFETLRTDVLDRLDVINTDVSNKVNSSYFESWKDQIEDKVESKVNKQSFDNLYESVETITTNLAVEIKNRVTHDAFNAFKESVKNHVTQEQYDELYQAVKDATENLAKNIENKVSLVLFETTIDKLELELKSKADQQSIDNIIPQIEDLRTQIAEKADNDAIFGALNSAISDITDILSIKVNKQDFDNFYEAVEDVTGKLAYEINTKLDKDIYYIFKSQIEAELSTKATQQAFDNLAVNVITKENLQDVIDEVLINYNQLVDNYIKTPEFEAEIKSIVEQYINSAADYYTKSETYNKSEINYKTAVLNNKFNDYYNKTEVDDIISNIDISGVDLSDYWKKSETYNRTQIDTKIEEAVQNVTVDLSDYPTKTEVANDYYNKSQVDAKLISYRLKDDSYSKTEIDNIIGDINTILDNVLYTY